MNTTFQKLASLGFAALVGLGAAMVQAKLPPAPPLTDEQKAKAEEAKAKKAETDKKEADLLVKYQDKAAENYKVKAAAKSAATGGTTAAAPAATADAAKKP
jgi:hypothetical protein